MNIYEQKDDYANHNDTVGYVGIMLKTILGLVIAFSIAIPNLFEGNLFLSWLYNIDSYFTRLIASILVSVVLGIIWSVLYRSLANIRGKIAGILCFVLASILTGLFLGNSLIVAVMIISYYGSLNANDVVFALQITSGATFIAVLGGILALPTLKLNGKAIKLFENLAKILMFLALASGIMWIVGMIFAMFGLHSLLDLFYTMFYGIGPLSLIISGIFIILAEAMFLLTLGRIKVAVGKEPKHMENFYSMILVNAIIRLYVEIFKFVLKIIARSKRD